VKTACRGDPEVVCRECAAASLPRGLELRPGLGDLSIDRELNEGAQPSLGFPHPPLSPTRDLLAVPQLAKVTELMPRVAEETRRRTSRGQA
jgi:hypothetical protein